MRRARLSVEDIDVSVLSTLDDFLKKLATPIVLVLRPLVKSLKEPVLELAGASHLLVAFR